jgi:hypothetical protein
MVAWPVRRVVLNWTRAEPGAGLQHFFSTVAATKSWKAGAAKTYAQRDLTGDLAAKPPM